MITSAHRLLTGLFIRAGLLGGTVALLAVMATATAAEPEPPYSETDRSHWSFQPRSNPPVPGFADAADRQWVRTPIDAFVLERLKRVGLRPSPPADRLTLLRRITYDLTGLPPTLTEIREFLDAPEAEAIPRLVDTLLSRPQYGEKWAQHWLDVVRYAESEGFEYDRHIASAWMYRDYVIHAFNTDKPYDEFVREQLAGDELAPSALVTTLSGSLLDDPDHARRIASGFHRLGPVRRNAGNPDVAFSRNEILTERTDVIGVAFLGLSVGCARCHDHMFDPIRQTDYYRLQAYLAATHDHDLPLTDPDTFRQWKAESDAVTAEVEQLQAAIAQASTQEEERLKQQLAEVRASAPAPLPTLFGVQADPERVTPIHLLNRGDEQQRGRALSMRPLGVLVPEGTPERLLDPRRAKTTLAHWIADPEHPLTARVIVNRVWQGHFGKGLVGTPNDFGANGHPPTHPELLDWLAGEFVRSGWSIKSLHRLILASNVYRQSSGGNANPDALARDASNDSLWRFERRRLTAEEIRDSLLAVSGSLDSTMGGPSVMVPVDPDLVGLLYDPEQWQVTADPRAHDRRSIYLMSKRNLRLPLLEVFDQPDLQTSCARREQSTHAPQALELMNGEFSNRMARRFADRLPPLSSGPVDDAVESAFLLVTGRPPTPDQRRLSREFLEQGSSSEFALALFNLHTFLYVD
jgi:hypothetical protein